jgi:hypothetical protein
MLRPLAHVLFAALLLLGCTAARVAETPPAADVSQYVGEPDPADPKACPPHRGSNIGRPRGRDATAAEKQAALDMFRRSPTGRTIVDQFSMSMADGAAKRQNTTRHSHDPSHGNQLSFSTSDGRTYLWYPGNAVVLRGEWRACEDRFGMTQRGETTTLPFGKICFRFGPGTYNPATGAKGNEWECAAASKVESTIVEQRPGDVFGLAKRDAVPFVLPRERTSMADLLARMPKGGAR